MYTVGLHIVQQNGRNGKSCYEKFVLFQIEKWQKPYYVKLYYNIRNDNSLNHTFRKFVLWEGALYKDPLYQG